jgi:hypothetical protein
VRGGSGLKEKGDGRGIEEGRWETGVKEEEGIEKTGTGLRKGRREQRERSRMLHHPLYETLTIRDCLQ